MAAPMTTLPWSNDKFAMGHGKRGCNDGHQKDRMPHWGCRCGFATNWASRAKCYKCGDLAPIKVRDKIAADAKVKTAEAKTASRRSGGDRGNGRGSGDAAEEEVHKQLQDEIRKLRSENTNLRKARPDAGVAPGSAAMDLDADDAMAKAIVAARDRLQAVRDTPECSRDLLAGGYEACLAQCQGELAAAQAAKRAANPLDKQLEGAEAYKSRVEKRVAGAKEALAGTEQEQAEAAKRVAQQQKLVAEAEAELAAASAEVAALAAQYAATRAAGPPAAADAAPVGFVSVAFAEERWQEREAAYSQQLAQLTALVAATQGDAAAKAEGDAGGASQADDTGSIEDVDDENWATIVNKDKRLALLRKPKEELAARVRAKLGKVSAVRSPFLKR